MLVVVKEEMKWLRYVIFVAFLISLGSFKRLTKVLPAGAHGFPSIDNDPA